MSKENILLLLETLRQQEARSVNAPSHGSDYLNGLHHGQRDAFEMAGRLLRIYAGMELPTLTDAQAIPA